MKTGLVTLRSGATCTPKIDSNLNAIVSAAQMSLNLPLIGTGAKAEMFERRVW